MRKVTLTIDPQSSLLSPGGRALCRAGLAELGRTIPATQGDEMNITDALVEKALAASMGGPDWKRGYMPEAIKLRTADMRAAILAVAGEIAGDGLETAQDKIDGLESDLDSALDVLWRRGDNEAREWVRMNYKWKVGALEQAAAIRARKD